MTIGEDWSMAFAWYETCKTLDIGHRWREDLVVSIACNFTLAIASIMSKHRICVKGDIDCFCDVQITGEA